MAKRKATYEELFDMVQVLIKKVSELEEEIRHLKHPKDSNNSSIPPSKDENRVKKNQSLRERSGKKSGGQKGHKGSTLKMTSTPDEIIQHTPCQCNGCGSDLSLIKEQLQGRRQEIDIPPIRPKYKEHQIFSKTCSCGHVSYGQYPQGIDNHIQYGPNIVNLIAYFNVGQYLPYARMQSIFNNVFNLKISQGSIQNMLVRFSNKLAPMYEKIRINLEYSNIVGADETGVKVNGDKWWFWTWQNNSNTFITASDNRGYSTIEKSFPSGFINAHLVSDCYSAHLKTPALSHQLCLSHLIRDLNYIIEVSKSFKAVRLKMLLVDALNLKQKIPESQFNKPNLKRTFIRKEIDRLLASDLDGEHKKVKTFFKRMVKLKNYIIEFLYHQDVPADNNGSERAIRNAKVKQKVSTQFKSQVGVINYAIIRSVFDTCIKRDIDIFQTHKLNLALNVAE